MKKLGLLLASIGAGLLLVGGTVAAYIVTSADTLGARVSPGNLQEDATGHITLDWGSKTIANVSGLEVGSDHKRQIAELTLTASSTDAGSTPEEIATNVNSFTGSFSVSITNLSNPGSGPDLKNFLSIKTYKYETSAYALGACIDGEGSTSGQKGDKFKTEVELLSSYQTTDTASVFDVISQQIVYVSFSWGPDASSTDVQNVRTIYFVNDRSFVDDAEHDVYFYAYKGAIVNKAFPGEKMEKVYQTSVNDHTYDVYAIEFDASKFTNYNFNNGVHANELAVAAPANAVTALETTPYYNGTAWAAKPTKLLAPYYVRGSIGNVDYWGANADQYAITQLVHQDKTEYEITITLAIGDEIKVYKPNGDAWFGPADNFKVTKAGSHTIYVDENHIYTENDGWVNGMYVAQPE